MTQDIATTAGSVVEVSSSPPTLSAGLGWRVDRFLRDLSIGTLTVEEREEAQRVSVAYERFLRPAKHARIEEWMDRVAFSVTNPPPEGNRKARIALVIETSGDLPIACWTRETRAAFARHRGVDGRFWPSDAEVDAFLRPMANRLRRTAAALAEMGKPLPPPPPQPSEPTDEEKAQVAAKVDEFVAGMMESSRVWAVVDDAAQRLPVRSVTLKGRELWDRRNLARAASGLPALPEPASFDGYGTLPSSEGKPA